MDLLDSFRMFAGYNQQANRRLYALASQIDEAEYRRERQVSFGSMHALLNHMLLADGIWMARFAGGGKITPPLNTVLFDNFPALQQARVEKDREIVAFFDGADEEFLSRPLRYANSLGKDYVDSAGTAVFHFFNHQTHHRGQVHVLFSQTGVKPPSLDLHRIVHP